MSLLFAIDELRSFNQRFPLRSHHCHSQCMQRVIVINPYDLWWGQPGVVGFNIRGVLGGLFDGFHFVFAGGLVEGADDYGLTECYVFSGGHVSLFQLVNCVWQGTGQGVVREGFGTLMVR